MGRRTGLAIGFEAFSDSHLGAGSFYIYSSRGVWRTIIPLPIGSRGPAGRRALASHCALWFSCALLYLGAAALPLGVGAGVWA